MPKRDKKKPEGTCQLCLADKKKLVESHILPKWAYKNTNNKSDVITQIYSDSNVYGKPYERTPKGIYDNIMCADCEKKTQECDDVARKVFYYFPTQTFHPSHPYLALPSKLSRSYSVIELEKDELKKIILFFIVTIWRVHISHRKQFLAINLNNRFAEKARLSILKGDPELFPEIDVAVRFLPNSIHGWLAPLESYDPKHDFSIYHIYTTKYNFFIFLNEANQNSVPRLLTDVSIRKQKKIVRIEGNWANSKEKNAIKEILQRKSLNRCNGSLL